MNKEEIEKAKQCLNEIIQNSYAERKAIKLDNLRKYIQELEQKQFILDKVTDKLKEDIEKAKEQIKHYERQYKTAKEKEDKFHIKSFHRQINRWQSRFETLKEILNIIEGKTKKQAEMEAAKKALDNM